ncbi:hypothetical protein [Solicola sp. PLA-1-18]|uniref:hypothetical protein n=1 Tax=Solicola sp. PLA-1-18 TaxID=3380532 RepID=UPI003B78EA92
MIDMTNTKPKADTRYVVLAPLVQLCTSEGPYIGPNHVYEKQFREGDTLPTWISETDLALLLEFGMARPIEQVA